MSAASDGSAVTSDEKAISSDTLPDNAAPIGVQQQRNKGWRMPPNTRSVARPGRFGNVYVPGPAFVSEGVRIPELTAADCVRLCRERWVSALANYPSARMSLRELTGWNLACWCPLDAPCHRNVLLELANGPLVCEAV